MERPEWNPVVVVAKTKRVSGPIPASTAFLKPRDQVMNHLWLAPSPVALTRVPHGHDLEIPMAFWGAIRATGTSLGSIASIPMGARCGADLTPNLRMPGHATVRKAAGTANREFDEEDSLLLSTVYLLDTGLLMGAPQGGFSHPNRICGADVPATRGVWLGNPKSEIRNPNC
jgi:hypothetical protein